MTEHGRRLEERIRKSGLLQAGGSYVLALSGGADSVCLLLLLKALQKTERYKLHAVHLNHGLRQDACLDEDFCRQLCEEQQIPISIFREDVAAFARDRKIGIEEAGRILRYQFAGETARRLKADAILTAHHQHDQAETILMNLIRGSGLTGLSGMAPKQAYGEKQVLIRPLLYTEKAEILAYLQGQDVSWREDASNEDVQYTRNLIRHQLLPQLEAQFPGAVPRMAAAASHLAEAEDYLKEAATTWLSEHRKGNTLPLPELESLAPALQYYVWRGFLRENRVRDISAVHYEALKALPGKSSGTRLMLPGNRLILREQKTVRLCEIEGQGDEPAPAYSVETFPYKGQTDIPNAPYTKWLDYAIIQNGFEIRHRRQGDFLYLPGGEKKSLNRYLIDQKIPLGERDKLWLLADGSHVIWLIPHRLSHQARVTDQTEIIAEIRVFPEGK